MPAIRNQLKKLLLRLHRLGLRLKVIVLPAHYYVGIPNVLELEQTREHWAKRSAMPGVFMDVADQARALRGVCLPFQGEYANGAPYQEAVRQHFGQGYGFIEAQALHAVIRHYKPQRIIEVGSGISTYCMNHALTLNEQEGSPPTDLTCIEPFPSAALKRLTGITLIDRPVQQVPLSTFEDLVAGDFLFIDSSHTVKAGGDVNFLILEVLPRLTPGVVVHFHDIFFPYDYQRDLLQTVLYWSESSLLHAYLVNNARTRILFSLSLLHYDSQEALKELFPSYEPQTEADGLAPMAWEKHFPSSIYLIT